MQLKVKNLIHKFRFHTFFLVFLSFVGLSIYSQFSSKEVVKTSVINEGLHTCFARVNQSFTARFLGSMGSPYLTDSFMKATEECYADVTYVLEDNFKILGKNSVKKIHNLSSNIHWLHRNLIESEEAIKGKVNIGSRFQEIEGMNDHLLEEIRIMKENIEFGILWSNFLFYPFIIMTMTFFLFEFFNSKRKKSNNEKSEREALIEVQRGESLIVGKVENIILSALKNNGLEKCASLFSMYQNQVFDGKVTRFLIAPSHDEGIEKKDLTKKEKEPIDCKLKEEKKEVEKKIPKSISKDTISQKTNNNSGILLDTVLSKVIDIHSGKIFTQGIKLDLNVEDDIFVQIDQESLEQMFYYLILNAINASEVVQEKKITINLKKLGGTVLVETSYLGRSFPKELILDQLGLEKLGEDKFEKALGIELTIVNSLAKENESKLTFENIKKPGLGVIGSKLRLTLTREKKVQLVGKSSEIKRPNQLV